MLSKLGKKDLLEARVRIKDMVHQTPVVFSSSVNDLIGCRILFKCENFQKAGAFKIRGASNAILSLSRDELSKGIATHSSGNHAQAVALAASCRNAKAYIVMPKNSSNVKVEAVKGYGGEITWSDPDLCSREDTLDLVKNQTGATFVHPYDDDRIIAGQSTCMQEFLEQTNNELDAVFAPIGGGGLMSGTALAVKHFSPEVEVYGAEPRLAGDAHEAVKLGKWVPAKPPTTVADGLRTALGRRNFEIIREEVSEIFLVEEEEILDAMRLIWERMKIIIEPSCAVPVAALIRNKEKFVGRTVGIILSGGNVDLGKLGQYFRD